MSRQEDIFLTQAVSAAQTRKHFVAGFVAQSESSEFAQASRKAEQLLTMVQGVKPNETVATFRQMRRGMKQAHIQGESEVVKTEKCALIDLEYFKKLVANEPVLSFQNMERALAVQQQENQQILEELLKLDQRLARIEEDIG